MALSITDLAERVRAAMGSNDLEALAALMSPDVRWGAPDDLAGGCQNRDQARAWYEAAMARGVRASVNEVEVGDGCLLVGLTVHGSSSTGEECGPTQRWQVLTVDKGLVADIRGFDSRADAAARAGVA